MVIRKVLWISTLLVLPALAPRAGRAQTLRGRVTDVQSREGIADATVYLPEQHRGTATLSDGTFIIQGAKAGPVLLQVTHVGFKSYFLSFNLSQDTTLQIELEQSLLAMKEVVITGASMRAPTSTTWSVASVSASHMMRKGSISLSDAIAALPGMSQLTTGVGISKPVIRGLYGNRIQVNVNGIRFDNQQWQDEHGLGLSDMGVDRAEIIKGPASVLYGSDAMGGVINIIEEKPAPQGKLEQDVQSRLFSNTYGLSLNYGLRKTNEKVWWKLRAGLDSHADYTDGNNDRVLNSRFANYNLKASLGFDKSRWSSANSLMLSYGKFGFVFDSLGRKERDARLSRSFDGPHHQVFIGQVASENTFFARAKKIKLNLGVSTNLRQEDEGGGGISLSMMLNSFSLLSQVEQMPGRHSHLTYGASLFFQTNTNYGGRIIVPDAFTGDLSAFLFYRFEKERWLLETGTRYDRKFISTRATGSLNVIGSGLSPTDEIVPFNHWYNAVNVTGGAGYNFNERITLKLNGSTGYRPGNLAELSSNGLHEGTLRWEIGKPDAKIEQNFNSELSLEFRNPTFQATLAVYRNQFWNYIYLAPAGEEYFGFQIYHFTQTDAVLAGGELSLHGNPNLSWLEWQASYSFIDAQKSDGDALPLIPANRAIGGLTIHLASGRLSQPSVNAEVQYNFKQHKPGEFETDTPAYTLINVGASASTGKTTWALRCNNIFNVTYFDHLSRFKYFGIYNAGRTITLSASIHF